VQLLGEEINTQVSVLASGSRGGDANDLARAALKDQEITDANVMAWDGDGVGGIGGLGGGAGRLWARTIFIVITHFGGVARSWFYSLFDDSLLLEERLDRTGRVNGLLGKADFLSLLRLEGGRWVNSSTCDWGLGCIWGREVRNVDGSTGDWALGCVWGTETRSVDGSTGDTNLFLEGGLWVARRVNSGTADTNLLLIGWALLWLESGSFDGGDVYARLFTVCRLEAATVLTFSNVDFGGVVVSVLTTTRTFDYDFGFLLTMEVWEVRKLNVDLS